VAAELRKEFFDLFQELGAAAKAGADSVLAEGSQRGATKWFRPPTPPKDLTDTQQIAKAFDRTGPNQDYTDSLSGGRVGDFFLSQLQVDETAALERAFRARHLTRPRAAVLAAARSRAHGDTDTGVIKSRIIGYLEEIAKITKSAKPKENGTTEEATA
jgi:hypothetical protein